MQVNLHTISSIPTATDITVDVRDRTLGARHDWKFVSSSTLLDKMQENQLSLLKLCHHKAHMKEYFMLLDVTAS